MNLKSITILTLLLLLISCGSGPKYPYQNTKLSFDERAEDLVSRMTLEEKVSQLTHYAGEVEHLGIPRYNWWNECLHGVARAGKATVFPQSIGIAATFDRDMMFRMAEVTSDEARAKYHDFEARDKRGMYQGLTFWSPNINIFRDPRWGRGHETYGEDPYLSGEMGVQFIKGLQGDDPRYLKVVATSKHYAVHSGPEPSRHEFDAVIGERDFRDTYFPAFKKTVEEGRVYSVMCAYNRYMGEPCCGSIPLQEELLRGELGFEGYIVSDCGAIRDFHTGHNVVKTSEQAAAKGVLSGTDLNCGRQYKSLVKAVEQGLILESEVDVPVTRLMLARMKLGMFDPDEMVPWSATPLDDVAGEAHKKVAAEMARKTMVLFKKEKRQNCSSIGENPEKSESVPVNPPAKSIQQHQGHNAANKIGKSCCKLINTKNLHGDHLQPEKQWGFLRKGLKVNLHIHVIMAKDHFPGRFCIVHLIGIKEVNRSQEGQHQERGQHHDPQIHQQGAFTRVWTKERHEAQM